MSRIHHLKLREPYFQATWEGKKRAEIRQTHDRDFQTEDVMVLTEVDNEGRELEHPRKIHARITHVLHGGIYGLNQHTAMLSHEIIEKFE